MCGKGPPWREKLESCQNMEDATFKTTKLNIAHGESTETRNKNQGQPRYSPRSRRQKTRGTSKGERAATGAEARNSGWCDNDNGKQTNLSEHLQPNMRPWKWPINTGWCYAAPTTAGALGTPVTPRAHGEGSTCQTIAAVPSPWHLNDHPPAAPATSATSHFSLTAGSPNTWLTLHNSPTTHGSSHGTHHSWNKLFRPRS